MVDLAIDNQTRWDGRTIRSLVLMGLKAHGITDHCRVVVCYQRKGARVRGYATVGGRWMKLFMPRNCAELDTAREARMLTSIIDHEILHLKGLTHRQFPKHARWCHDRGAPWHPEGWQIVHLPEPEAPSAEERADEKLEHVRAMHAKALTRLKRAKTIETKWRRKLQTEERKLAAGRRVRAEG